MIGIGVLLVDDDKNVLDAYQRHLRDKFRVVVATSPAEGTLRDVSLRRVRRSCSVTSSRTGAGIVVVAGTATIRHLSGA